MGIIVETFGGVALFIALGLVVFWLFASLLVGDSNNKEDKYQELSAIYSGRQIARRNEMSAITHQILDQPKCRDGSNSALTNRLWKRHRELKRIDEQLTAQERNQLVEARGYLPDDIADIIEGIDR